MVHINVTKQRMALYVIGLFLLSLGVSFSIQAALGVSPVSSLAYSLSLTAGLSIGITTVLANALFIIVQVILNQYFDLRAFILQLLIAFLFGFFMDATLFLVHFLPSPVTIIGQSIYLIISLFVVAVGLFGYMTAKLPLMPYDALTSAISNRFKLAFGKAKVTSDWINVGVAVAVSLVFIQSLGAVGIGTLAAAYFIGKIVEWLKKTYTQPLKRWMNVEETIRLKDQENNQGRNIKP